MKSGCASTCEVRLLQSVVVTRQIHPSVPFVYPSPSQPLRSTSLPYGRVGVWLTRTTRRVKQHTDSQLQHSHSPPPLRPFYLSYFLPRHRKGNRLRRGRAKEKEKRQCKVENPLAVPLKPLNQHHTLLLSRKLYWTRTGWAHLGFFSDAVMPTLPREGNFPGSHRVDLF